MVLHELIHEVLSLICVWSHCCKTFQMCQVALSRAKGAFWQSSNFATVDLMVQSAWQDLIWQVLGSVFLDWNHLNIFSMCAMTALVTNVEVWFFLITMMLNSSDQFVQLFGVFSRRLTCQSWKLSMRKPTVKCWFTIKKRKQFWQRRVQRSCMLFFLVQQLKVMSINKNLTKLSNVGLMVLWQSPCLLLFGSKLVVTPVCSLIPLTFFVRANQFLCRLPSNHGWIEVLMFCVSSFFHVLHLLHQIVTATQLHKRFKHWHCKLQVLLLQSLMNARLFISNCFFFLFSQQDANADSEESTTLQFHSGVITKIGVQVIMAPCIACIFQLLLFTWPSCLCIDIHFFTRNLSFCQNHAFCFNCRHSNWHGQWGDVFTEQIDFMLKSKDWLISGKLSELFLRTTLCKQTEISFFLLVPTATSARQKLHVAKSVLTFCAGLALLPLIDSSALGVACFSMQISLSELIASCGLDLDWLRIAILIFAHRAKFLVAKVSNKWKTISFCWSPQRFDSNGMCCMTKKLFNKSNLIAWSLRSIVKLVEGTDGKLKKLCVNCEDWHHAESVTISVRCAQFDQQHDVELLWKMMWHHEKTEERFYQRLVCWELHSSLQQSNTVSSFATGRGQQSVVPQFPCFLFFCTSVVISFVCMSSESTVFHSLFSLPILKVNETCEHIISHAQHEKISMIWGFILNTWQWQLQQPFATPFLQLKAKKQNKLDQPWNLVDAVAANVRKHLVEHCCCEHVSQQWNKQWIMCSHLHLGSQNQCFEFQQVQVMMNANAVNVNNMTDRKSWILNLINID